MLWQNNKLRLLVTGECNLKCFYCHNEGMKKSALYMPSRVLERVLEILQYARRNPVSVTFSGGEALLHPDLNEFIIQLAPFVGSISLTTNGTLLTSSRLEQLQAAGLSKLRIGIDSVIRKKTRPSPGNASVINVVETLDWVMRMIRVELNVVLSEFNILEIPALIAFCESRRLSAKLFHCVNYGNSIWRDDMQNQGIQNGKFSCEYIERSIDRSGNSRIRRKYEILNGANVLFDYGDFKIAYCKYLHPYQLCGETGTRIDALGGVYVCMEARRRPSILECDQIEACAEMIERVNAEGCGG